MENEDRGFEVSQDLPNPRRLSRLPRSYDQLRAPRTQLKPAVAGDERMRQRGCEQSLLLSRLVEPRVVDTERRQECRIHTGRA